MLKKRIIQEKVEIVMIQETKCDRTSMEKLAKKIWKGCEVEAVDSETLGCWGRFQHDHNPLGEKGRCKNIGGRE
jgi:hypothetical protein